jgi:hypothetical protein
VILVKKMLKKKPAANAPPDKVKEGEQKADEAKANFTAQFFEALAKKLSEIKESLGIQCH